MFACSFHRNAACPFAHNNTKCLIGGGRQGPYWGFTSYLLPGNRYLVLSLMTRATLLVSWELERPHAASVQTNRNEEPAPAFSCSGGLVVSRVGWGAQSTPSGVNGCSSMYVVVLSAQNFARKRSHGFVVCVFSCLPFHYIVVNTRAGSSSS